jgi:N-acetylmuramic acid 6-phosphate etherase
MGNKASEYEKIDLSTVATEQESLYKDLEIKNTEELVQIINFEDAKVAYAVDGARSQIVAAIDIIVEKILNGGRLFYIGTWTSGRIGIVDASEMLPTYGIWDKIIGLMAWGDDAIRTPAEFAEDNPEQWYTDLISYGLKEWDVVLGSASSGRTPYVEHALRKCREAKITTISFICSPAETSPVAKHSDHVIEVLVGPEVVTGSTRMKSWTAQKMVLNIISTTLMIHLGRVKGNRMIRMKPTNKKLMQRALDMVKIDFPLVSDEIILWLLDDNNRVVEDVKTVLAKG